MTIASAKLPRASRAGRASGRRLLAAAALAVAVLAVTVIAADALLQPLAGATGPAPAAAEVPPPALPPSAQIRVPDAATVFAGLHDVPEAQPPSS